MLQRKLLPDPHPCGICKTRVATSLPTCSSAACRKAWRKQTRHLQQVKRRAYVREHLTELCTTCHKANSKSSIDAGLRTCFACRKMYRERKRKQAEDHAHNLYVARILLLRAQRKIERFEKAQNQKKVEVEAEVERIFGPKEQIEHFEI